MGICRYSVTRHASGFLGGHACADDARSSSSRGSAALMASMASSDHLGERGGIGHTLSELYKHPPNSLYSLRKATCRNRIKCTVNARPNIPNPLGPSCQYLLQLPLSSLPAQLPSDLGRLGC